jgi:putative flavoprotein involved in K+ transport
VADYLQAYAAAHGLPVQLHARVTELRRVGDDFEVHTADAAYRARQVVVATGPFQVRFVSPPAAKLDPSVTQVHSAAYRNPQALPEGPVLVVGGGNSGFQIAEELAATRTVDLSIATTYPLLPQRRLGRDLFWWLTRLGLLRVTVTSRPARRASRRDFVIGPIAGGWSGAGCGSGRGWSTPTGVRSASPTTASWRMLGWWCGRPGIAPTTPGSTSPGWSVRAMLCTGGV